MHTNTHRMKPGFTLIELLLVLVILAALAGIVVPKFARRSEQALVTKALSQISSFETALEAFEVDLGRYPTTQEGLDALVKKPVNLDKWEQPYLSRSAVPMDPWKLPYAYRQPGQHNQYGYDLSSSGPDGQSGGEDDISNWSNEDGSSG